MMTQKRREESGTRMIPEVARDIADPQGPFRIARVGMSARLSRGSSQTPEPMFIEGGVRIPIGEVVDEPQIIVMARGQRGAR